MQQLTLIELESNLSDRSHLAVGALGEAVAGRLLERAGYEVTTIARQPRRGDLLAISRETGERWQVEVKTARRDKRGLYQWNLVKNDKHGHTDCKDADWLILLAVEASGRAVVFLIPVSAVGELKTIKLKGSPRAYAGRWARYRCNGRIDLEQAK